MITILHGDDIIASKEQLYRLKEQFSDYEIISISGEKIIHSEIINIFNLISLFNPKRLIIIENLLGSGSETQKEQVLNFFKNTLISDNVIIWEAKEVKSSLLMKYFPKAKVILCKIPQILFRFLDNIGKEDASNLLTSFQNITRDKEAEFIYVMILRQIRLLIMVREQKGEDIGLASWQIYKLANQARYFNYEQLLSLYRRLLNIEYKIKSGQTPYTMKESLDIFFAGL